MTNDKEPGWAKIRLSQTVDELCKYGPTIQINVAATVDGSPQTSALAQIDTGAAGTGISPKLAKLLGLSAIYSGTVHHPGMQPIEAPFFRARLFLPGTQIDLDVVELATLDPPHDVLIGRDILVDSVLQVDFLTGKTLWHIKGGT